MKLFTMPLASLSFLSFLFVVVPMLDVYASDEVDSTKIHDPSKAMQFVNAVPLATTFTEVASLTGIIYGDMEWGDYDNDGDLDVVVTGNASEPSTPVPFTKIYRNTNGVFSEDTDNDLSQLSNGSVAWGDYDRDGDIDLLLSGYLPDNHTKPTTTVYKNDNGILTELPDVSIPGVYYGSGVDWVDWDNDGDLDIFISGLTWLGESTITTIAKFYRNNQGTFELFPYGVPPVSEGDVVWSDVDNDRDFDILLTGINDYTGLWLNNGESYFTSSGSFDGLSSSSAVWGDFDSDGDQDLIVSGTKYNSGVGGIAYYKNDVGTFTSVGTAGITAHYESSMSAGDYDNDGDLDILLTGFTAPVSSTNTTLYANDGTGNFTQVSGAGFIPVRSGEAKWGDYDNDGDLDVIVSGSNSSWGSRYTTIYRNNLNGTNAAPTVPTGLQSFQVGTDVIFQWNAATDAQGGKVTYNLRVGTTPGGSEIMSTSSDPETGYHRIAEPGNIKIARSWNVKNLPSEYYWSVQAIDNSLKAGNFSTEAHGVMLLPVESLKAKSSNERVVLSWTNPNETGHFTIYRETQEMADPIHVLVPSVSDTFYVDTDVTNGLTYYYYVKVVDDNENATSLRSANAKPETFSVITLPPVEYGSSAWGDYDGDGDYDVVVTGWGPPEITDLSVKLYNNADGTFTQVPGPPLLSAVVSYASWNDYDNDNDLDLLVTGAGDTTSLYKNVLGEFLLVDNTNLPNKVRSKQHAWADFDNDGDVDLGMPAYDDRKFLMRNDRSVFSQIGESSAYSVSMAWGDYDNDGDMDYASGTGIYKNTEGVFEKVSDGSVLSYGTVAWADIDNDRDLDLVTSGVTNFDNSIKAVTYRNDGTQFTQVSQLGMVPFPGSDLTPASISAGDYDYDGDLDLLVSGTSSWQPYATGSGMYVNDGNGMFTPEERITLPQTNSANSSWGDYDQDGDLDVIMNGNIASNGYFVDFVNIVIKNNLNNINYPPNVPSGLQATHSDSTITFTWNVSTDVDGGPVTYNLRVGTTPGGSQVMSAVANSTTGRLLIPTMGNVQLNRSWKVKEIGAGSYYWSVQAIDGAFAGSTFASEKQITLSTQTVSFAELDTVMVDHEPFTLNASSTSGLPVLFVSSDSSVATIDGNLITIVGGGITNITASQPGNNSYATAAPITRTLVVNKFDQTITFLPIGFRAVGDAPFTLTATASSGLSVDFAKTSDKISLVGNTVTILKAGSVTVTATQPGDAFYNAASNVDQTFCVNPSKPSITLSQENSQNIQMISSAAEGNQWYLNDQLIESATASSWHPVEGGCTLLK